ncbi:MAG: hypothetical protein A2070_11760 [Bdellovibrionales bacterium GWC1_52_8]|nr:MAG: hypothetical protein A2Z97_13470 [Bdellovibrionales bacterium GWB1_52_6]OFZ03177.1 MAG: hypothetical protein A2X97_04140 [Bdellovibrionales bacterium GWA1_52_35]OFZ35196.1 MAG: hypothetical protein A2070_11760 [Bdellovibrionales bacterium GWC1_52_8]HCM38328.1 hypothetical protein [Bdellovibrionales bacterium]
MVLEFDDAPASSLTENERQMLHNKKVPSIRTEIAQREAEATPLVKSHLGIKLSHASKQEGAHSFSPTSRLSLLAVVSQVPVRIRSIHDIHR